MGVRPPPTSDDEEPETIAFGIAALDARLEDVNVEFPATRAELERTLGGVEVPYDASGSTIALETALQEVPRDSFETRQELLNALHPVFEKQRRASGSGVLAQFRSLLPF